MWFRNLQIFRLTDEWDFSSAALGERLGRGAFRNCGATEMQSLGWVPPRGEPGELVVAVARQQLVALGVEQKLLPGWWCANTPRSGWCRSRRRRATSRAASRPPRCASR